jgi:hypothetical protein
MQCCSTSRSVDDEVLDISLADVRLARELVLGATRPHHVVR